ncbi:MAG: Flp pilus assembly protein CpaB [Candidatus Riflebacteria bacterium]|nr:Flp pilus assembly protein CpaB [Candidatus Riflebacteria bacterium]
MNRKAIIFALVVSLVITFGAWKYMQSTQPKPENPVFVPPPSIPMTNVVVVKKRVGARIRLDKAMIADSFDVKEMNASMTPVDSFPDTASFTNRYTAVTLFPGDVMVPDRLLASDAVPNLSFAIPPGRRAVTIAVSKVTGVAGFIQQGDYVDIIATFRPAGGEPITKIVLQDIPILAIGKTYEFDSVVATAAPAIAANNAELVTMAVTPDELERLTLLDTGFTFRLVLKNPKDKGERITTKGTTEKMVMSDMGIGPNAAEASAPAAPPSPAPTPAPTPVVFVPPTVSMPPVTVAAEPAGPEGVDAQTAETGKIEVFYGRRREEMSKYGAQSVSALTSGEAAPKAKPPIRTPKPVINHPVENP